MDDSPLVPPVATARARALSSIPFGFGPRFFVAILLGFAWLVPAWWFPQMIAAMFLWDAAALAAWLWDLLQLSSPGQLDARRIWKARPALACASSVTIEVRNSGRTGIRARITDEMPVRLRLEPATLEIRVRAGSASRAEYSILPAVRGDARIGRTFIRYQSAIQLAERWAVADTAQVVRVLPNIEEAKQHTLFLIRSRQIEMERRRRRQRGMGREFDSLREYRDGDEIRDISWTATARRHHLITRVFEIERSQVVWLVLDAGRLLRAQVAEPSRVLRISKLDYAVNAALSLAQVALHCGDRVGLLAYGRRIQQNVNAARGHRHVRTLVESFSQVHGEAAEADHARAVHTLLAEQKRRSLVVWITDFAETPATPEVIDYAMHMTSRHLVLFVAMGQADLAAVANATPASREEMYRHVAALEIVRRRDVLMRGLRQRGVLAVELMPNALAPSLVNQYLDIKERSLL